MRALPTNLCSLTGAAMWVWVPDSNKFEDCCAEADGSESFSYVVGLVFRVLDGESYDVAVLFLRCCLIGHMMSLRMVILLLLMNSLGEQCRVGDGLTVCIRRLKPKKV